MNQPPVQCAVAVVDDDSAVRAALESLLRADGFNVELFGSAEDFLQSCAVHAAHCLILDIRLPGMSGLELLRQLARMPSGIPTICLTGQQDKDGRIRELALQAGARALFYKPFDAEELLQAVRSICDGERQPP